MDILVFAGEMGNHDFTIPRETLMNKINNGLRVSEIDTLSNTLLRLYRVSFAENSAISKDNHLATMMSEVEKAAAKISVAIKSDRAESTLDEADIIRDELIRNLSNALTGYASIPIPEKNSAASRLLVIFQKYGRGIVEKSYAEESSLVESLLGDLSSENAKADAQILDGIPELITALRNAQDAFHKASDSFTAAKTGKGESASSVKKRLQAIFNGRVIPYLEALASAPDYADFTDKCAAEITRANASVRIRSKGATGENSVKPMNLASA